MKVSSFPIKEFGQVNIDEESMYNRSNMVSILVYINFTKDQNQHCPSHHTNSTITPLWTKKNSYKQSAIELEEYTNFFLAKFLVGKKVTKKKTQISLVLHPLLRLLGAIPHLCKKCRPKTCLGNSAEDLVHFQGKVYLLQKGKHKRPEQWCLEPKIWKVFTNKIQK